MTIQDAGSDSPSPLVHALERFNRKERYWLLRLALGRPFVNLDAGFREKLETELKIAIPQNAWWAFDYHIDWLCGALLLLEHPDQPPESIEPQLNIGCVSGTQEDVDLVIAFGSTLILVEAKTGSWNNSQMMSKMERLSLIPFGTINPWLVLASPNRPSKLDHKNWPAWRGRQNAENREPHWIKLPFMAGIGAPLTVSRVRVGEPGTGAKKHWHIRKYNHTTDDQPDDGRDKPSE